MNHHVHFSNSIYGLAAGLFFLSYAPSELVGARRWIARIMFTWGVLAVGMMFVKTPIQFYTMRLLLGAAEAGFFPGVVFYLTQWFPANMRARAVTLTSSASASIVGTLAPRSPRRVVMQIDLHGYHPAEIVFNGTLAKILQQAWEMGEDELVLIHGHGRNRGISPGFVNTNTGYFGLCIRQALRHDKSLRQWIKHTTLDCWNMGSTSIRLKANRNPTRKQFDCL